MKNELKRYIKEINKGLHLPHKMKKRITTELLSEIYGRIDDGEELNSVLTSIGTPQELVEELEANYEHEYVLHIPQELRIRSRGTERHSASN